MKRIVFILLSVLLILGIFAAGCDGERNGVPIGPCHRYWAPIKEDVAIWAEPQPPVAPYYLEYYLYVLTGWSSCDQFWDYDVTYVGNGTQEVDVVNGTCYWDPCPPDSYVARNISFGALDPGEKRTIIVNNNVTVTFVTGVMFYLAPIHDIEIWDDESSASQYFVDVVSGETSICDHFDSYNVTRAGNTTVIVEILNRMCGIGCPVVYRYVENTIPLGSDFVPGGNYTVVVNNMTEDFIG